MIHLNSVAQVGHRGGWPEDVVAVQRTDEDELEATGVCRGRGGAITEGERRERLSAHT